MGEASTANPWRVQSWLCLVLEKELGKKVMLHVFCTAGNGKFKSRLDAKWSAEDLKRYRTSELLPFFSI